MAHCPNHIIVLEIPVEADASNSALKSTAGTNANNPNNIALTAKSPVDNLKNAKHPFSVRLFLIVTNSIYLLFILFCFVKISLSHLFYLFALKLLIKNVYTYLSICDSLHLSILTKCSI